MKNTLPPQEEVIFLRESNFIEREYSEQALSDAITAWQYLKKEDQLTVDVVLKTHKLLMRTRDFPKEYMGKFRWIPVYIGNREGLHYSQIKPAMEVWLLNANLYKEHWKRNHVRYEHIHPFADGNGRTGRMFMNWMRIKLGQPVLTIYEKEKYDYYKWFTENDSQGL